MADTGKIATEGFGAGAIRYVVYGGFTPNAIPSGLQPCIASMGFGLNAITRVMLFGFAANPGVGGGGGGGGFCIFGGGIVTGSRVSQL